MPKKFNSLAMPAAMLLGFIFNGFFSRLSAALPWMLFAMLFVTLCRIDLSKVRFTTLHLWLLLIQLLGGVIVYLLLRPAGEALAQGIMVCVFASTAVSATVITGMLGGNIESIAAYTILSNVAVAFAAPVMFSFTGGYSDMPFWESFILIISRVGPLLLVPFCMVLLLRKLAPGWYAAVRGRQSISFWIWTAAIMIAIGRTVRFVIDNNEGNFRLEVCLGVGAFLICLLQFGTGKLLGRRYGDTIAAGQGLGQKNTILAIWMAQTYLDPIASLGPASYVIWQNIVNSWQIWRKQVRDRREVREPHVVR